MLSGRRRHSLASVRNLFRRFSGVQLQSQPSSRNVVVPEAEFTIQTRNLEVIKYAAFLYDDEVVRVVLEQLYARTMEYSEATSVCFTYEHDGSQLTVAQFGTLRMPAGCEAKESMCAQNRHVGSRLSIGDLKKSKKTAESKLVTGAPFARAYSGTRLTADLSIAVIFGSPLKEKTLAEVEEKMQQSVAFARSLLTSHRVLDDDDGLRFAVDRDGKIVRATPSCDAYFAREDDADIGRIVGQPLTAVLAGVDFDPWDATKTEIKGIRSEASGRIFDARCVHFERVAVVCVIDRTVRKKLGDKEMELRVQRQVVSQLAHELRNKFTASIDVMQTAVECFKTLAPETAAPLLDMESDMNAAIQLLHEGNQLLETRLTLHRISQGTYDLDANLELVDVERYLARFAREFLGQRQVQFGVTIRVHVEAETESPQVALDSYVLNHVLTSTLSNAISHSPPNSEVLLIVHSVTESEVVIGVRDEGCGIAKKLHNKLFDEGVLSAKERGVGLGLSSSAAYLRTVGGDIWLKSTSVAKRASLCDFSDRGERNSGKVGHTDIRFRMVRRRDREEQLYRDYRKSIADDDIGGGEKNGAEENDGASGERAEAAAVGQKKRVLVQGITQIHVIEDSTAMRRMIVKKLTSVLTDLDLGAPEAFEYETAEHAMEAMALAFPETGVPPASTLVTIDQNLQSKGGELMGTDMIDFLIKRGFAGTIVSCSGEDGIGKIHTDAGAHLVFGKPLPNAKQIKRLFKPHLLQQSTPSMRWILDHPPEKQQHSPSTSNPPRASVAPTDARQQTSLAGDDHDLHTLKEETHEQEPPSSSGLKNNGPPPFLENDQLQHQVATAYDDTRPPPRDDAACT